ncbi:alpha/beta fold hydrolase [Halomonas sp. CUBES01]|uniref:alpha/beta fold hydrolase n=1 Tax=Halomonas sp. CUBES01 TaxID=2897340 RepID=UPI001E560C40|nr:alpha/beta fold hydrolase [Halomonas sp. CUBES01]MEC4766297.1 alpha/beta fold hydrolase [Halomonas sp. CUBES01]
MPRLVLLSGWGVDRRIWAPLEAHWPADIDVLSVDWPGYGHQLALPENASLDQLAEAMVDRLPEDAVWVGWSLGGLLATALLDTLPAPRGLVLLGAGERFCADDGVSNDELASFRRAFTRDPKVTWQHFLRWQAQGEPNPRHAHRQLQALLGDQPSADHATLATGLDWLATLDNTQRLNTPVCPVIRLVGEHDPLVGQRARDRARRLAHAGHCPMLSKPATLAAVLAEQASALAVKDTV